MQKSINLSIILFIITTLIAPLLIINKIIFLIFIVLMLFKYGLKIHVPVGFAVIASIFFYGFLISQLTYSDSDLSRQLLFTVFIGLIVSATNSSTINLDAYIEKSAKVLIVCSFLYMISAIYPDISINKTIFIFFNENSSAVVTDKYYFDDPIMIYRLGCLPFLYLPFCIWLQKILKKFILEDFLWLTLCVLCIVLSGSRGLIISTILIALVLITLTLRSYKRVLFILASMAILWLSYLRIESANIFSYQEYSNHIKQGHLVSFFDYMDIYGWIFGNGLASFYYSSGIMEMVAQTELTPIDIVRYFGLPLAVLTYMSILFPTLNIKDIKHIIAHEKMLFFILVIYLLMSMSNPVLFNSYGMIVLVWYWTKFNYLSKTRFEFAK